MKPYNLTAQEFLNAHRVNRGLKIVILAPIVLLFVFFVIGGNRNFTDGELTSEGIRMICLMGGALLISPFFLKWKLMKIFNSHKAMQETVNVEFDTDKIHWEAESGNCTLNWCDIYSVKSGKSLVLIYETKQLMRIIPDRAFVSEQEHEEFIGYSNRNR